MTRFLRIVWAIVAAGTLTGASAANTSEAPVKVFALPVVWTGAMTAIIKLYQEKTGVQVQAEFGPAGLLRERIEGGARPDIFASANMAHPQALADKGLATIPMVMARNRICAKALPGFGLTTANLFERMLDPQRCVGIPARRPRRPTLAETMPGMVFARAGQARPGAGKILEAKARQLVGGKNNPPVPAGQDAMTYFFAQHQIDISLGYCSSRNTTPDPNFTTVELPPELAVNADYGLSVLGHRGWRRCGLLWFVMSPEAQHLVVCAASLQWRSPRH